MNLSGYKISRYKTPFIFTVTLIILIYLSADATEVSLSEFLDGWSHGSRLLLEFFPPDWSKIGRMLHASLLTIAMALIATPMGALISFLFGLAAAKNISYPGLREVARVVISLERALPEIVILLFLAAALGLGLYPGILALAIGSIGMLGRLLADAIEEIDEKAIESVETVGATRSQIIRYSIIPEVLPSFVANSIFRFEINIRNSVLLGAVGVGGIGYELNESISLMDYEASTMAIIMIISLVFVAERISDTIRKKVSKTGEVM
ncbi:MAG: phosphonate ABC transporter, permease protein PhnE [Opitutales bacterium]|nr:phosphonate ABC transporter, permease protein PhnE [Opitutales bacterium]